MELRGEQRIVITGAVGGVMVQLGVVNPVRPPLPFRLRSHLL